MKLTSSAFQNNSQIPSKYTCDGEDTCPPLIISDVPIGAKSLTLIVDDPDAPMGTFVHWIIFNLPTTLNEITASIKDGVVGKNTLGSNKFISPCPPSGTHRYFFKLYALDIELSLTNSVDKKEVENVMQNHILASAELIGLYSRK